METLKNSFILFFISPFLGLIQGFKHYREDWAKNSICLFVVFFGFTMFKGGMFDSSRYVMELNELYTTNSSWDVFVKNSFSEESGHIDIYQPVVSYFVSFFTNSGDLLFAIFGFVFGFFYSRNIWFLLDHAKVTGMNRKLWLLIFSFACMVGYWTLNGLRMWTAAHIFFYGAYLFFIENNKKGFFIVLTSVLVHYSFMLPVSLFLICALVRIPWRILYFTYMGSFFVAELNIASLNEKLVSIAPSFLLPKVNAYLNDENVENVTSVVSTTSWFLTYLSKSIGWFIAIMLTIVCFSKVSAFKKDKALNSFLGFTLLFLSISNIFSSLPSGGRFLRIAQLFGLGVVFLFYIKYNNKLFDQWLGYLQPVLVFFLVTSIRVSLDNTTVMTVFANPIIAGFVDLPIPLLNLFQ